MRSLETRGSVLVIGYGNTLRGDDGAGCYVAERLCALNHEPGLKVLSLHQLTPELAQPVAEAGLVIFIDASIQSPPATSPAASSAPATARSTPAPSPMPWCPSA